jgi:hypothetical protein
MEPTTKGEFWRQDMMPPAVISIANDGAKLVETNYWVTEQAKAGYYYLSTNAGYVRLLVPASRAAPELMADMIQNVREVVLTRGQFQGHDNCVEAMFEDGSKSPYCIHIDDKQVDRHWIPTDEHKRWRFAIWTELGLFAEYGRCYLRRHATLPYAALWGGKR